MEELTRNWAMDLVTNVIEDIDSDCAVVDRQDQCPYEYEVSTNFFEVGKLIVQFRSHINIRRVRAFIFEPIRTHKFSLMYVSNYCLFS